MTATDVSNEFSIFSEQDEEYSKSYAEFFELVSPTPESQFILIPYLTETFAEYLMNSLDFKQKWKQDFSRDSSTERWDLINSEGVTIEVKSTKSEDEFCKNSVRTSIVSQRESIVMKLLMQRNGIGVMKFVEFRINQEDIGKPIENCSGTWINITQDTVKSIKIWSKKRNSIDPSLQFSHLSQGCLECGSTNGEFFEEDMTEMSEGQMAEYMAGTWGEWTCFDCGKSAFREV